MVEKQIVNWVDVEDEWGDIEYRDEDISISKGSSIYANSYSRGLTSRHHTLLTLTVF